MWIYNVLKSNVEDTKKGLVLLKRSTWPRMKGPHCLDPFRAPQNHVR